jgi:hypothetical protein
MKFRNKRKFRYVIMAYTCTFPALAVSSKTGFARQKAFSPVHILEDIIPRYVGLFLLLMIIIITSMPSGSHHVDCEVIRDHDRQFIHDLFVSNIQCCEAV